MKILLIAMLLLGSTPAIAQASAAPKAQAAAAAKLTIDSPIEVFMANPAGKAILAKRLPGLATHSAYDMIKGMSVKQVQPLSGGAITDAAIAGIEADLKALRTAK